MADETKDPQKEENPENPEKNGQGDEEKLHDVTHISGMYEEYFLDYASYVIMERAVPSVKDGLKPVQRRILHAMRGIHDGRFHKVANIIGEAMKYHPHGDAAIGDALVNLGQKGLLIDTQGNWGDIRTGDSAAAPRYIEARLSEFAIEIAFNAKITEWQLSYDGRNKEPVELPMKFPLILAQGIEGIAVGLATKIMPHNFNELIDASIDHLKGKQVDLYPDFPTGGMVDITNYNQGRKGGRLRIRAKIEEYDKGTLVIRDIPFGTTTSTLIDSIIRANDQGKLKIKKVVDNTAASVEIFVTLPKNTDPDVTIDALYAFTDCEVSVAPNACVIKDEKPNFLSVNEILKICTDHTLDLLHQELQIKLNELREKWHFSSLEKIFIEKRIYRQIEECETWESVLDTIDVGLQPYKDLFVREITRDDIVRLTEIKIKRISKYDSFKADEAINKLEEDIEQTRSNIENLTAYAIDYFKYLKDKYGQGRERQTEIRSFEDIDVRQVAAATQKLYVNRKEGFIGTGLKKEEFVCEVSEVDDLIVFFGHGKFMITKVAEKAFVGKDIFYVNVWKRNDERTVYNALYTDGKTAVTRAKRFSIPGATRDKAYDLTKGTTNTRLLYFSANPNSESEVINIQLSPASKARKKVFDFDFDEIEIRNRSAQGNIVTKYAVKNVKFKEKGNSTLGGRTIWYQEETGRLNTEKRGKYLGEFDGEDRIIVFYQEGTYELTDYELTNRYEPDRVMLIEKFNPDKVITAIYYDGEQQKHFVKRFQIETNTKDKEFLFISEHKKSRLVFVTSVSNPKIELTTKQNKKKQTEEVNLEELVDVRNWKAVGKKVCDKNLEQIELLTPAEAEEETVENSQDKPPQDEQSNENDEQQMNLF